MKKLSQNISRLEAEKKKLTEQSQLINSFKKLKASAQDSAQKLQEAKNKAQALAKQLNATSKPTKKLQQDFERARKAVSGLKNEQQNHLMKLQRARQALQENGISTKSLGAAQAELSHKLKSANANIEWQKRALSQLNQIEAKRSSTVPRKPADFRPLV